MAEAEYKRITRTGSRSVSGAAFARGSLWLGTDHVLCVETSGYTESYKRFYFRDIQAVVISQTGLRTGVSILIGCLAVAISIIGFAAGNTTGLVVFQSLAALFVIALVVNILRGPTCRCQIRTAVQTETLPIGRLKNARKLLDQIRPFIAAAQGELKPEEISGRLQALAASTPAPEPAPVATSANPTRYVVDEPNLPPRMIS